jgi:hypothetical protein
VLDPAGQPNRVGAVAGGGHLLRLPLIPGPGPIDTSASTSASSSPTWTGSLIRCVHQQCSICFTTRILGGQLATSSETSEVQFIAPEQLDTLTIHPSMRRRIDHYQQRRSAPYIG